MTYNGFHNAIRKISSISDESLWELDKISELTLFRKNEFVLKEGAVCDAIYFVNQGLVRIYYYKQDKEISEWFAFENSFCFSIVSYFTKKPSHLIIQCLEDTEVLAISHDGLEKLRKTNFEISNFAFELISGSLILSQLRMESLQFETAQQRYENLVKAQPTIIQRVPVNYIASYLGISAETLSRIRAKIH
ncbi:MAG: Crp/Fnr family transcriptional regulator [Bacteroidales bacterium]